MATKLSAPRNLTCCCCGAATRGRQWWNRDTGYGLCSKCAAWVSTRKPFSSLSHMSAEEMRENYGVAGVHYNLA